MCAAVPRSFSSATHRNAMASWPARVWDRRGVSDRSQFENPYTVREFVSQVCGDFQRQTGLADPAHPGQRDESMVSNCLHYRGDLGLAPNEARRLRPQITRVEGPQWRKVGPRARRLE